MLIETPARRARKSLLALSAAVLAVSTLALLGVAPVYAADDPTDATVGISARPGAPDGAPDGRTRFSYQVDPGQRVDDTVVVVNTGTDVQHFTLFGTDAFSNQDGTFGLLPTDSQPEVVGSWVRFANDVNRMEFELAPGAALVVPFSVEVPPQAPPGDHAGGIVASVLTEGGQVQVDRRVAVRLYTRVSGDLQPILTISSFRAEHSGDWWNLLGGDLTLHYTVQNTGNVALAANATTTVSSWFGGQAAEVTRSTVEEILPGYSREIEQQVPGVGQWGYLIPSVRLNPYVDDLKNAELQLAVAAVSRDAFVLAPPWLVLIALGILALIALFVRWRRSRDERRAIEWTAYTEAEARRRAEEEVGAGSVKADARG